VLRNACFAVSAIFGTLFSCAAPAAYAGQKTVEMHFPPIWMEPSTEYPVYLNMGQSSFVVTGVHLGGEWNITEGGEGNIPGHIQVNLWHMTTDRFPRAEGFYVGLEADPDAGIAPPSPPYPFAVSEYMGLLPDMPLESIPSFTVDSFVEVSSPIVFDGPCIVSIILPYVPLSEAGGLVSIDFTVTLTIEGDFQLSADFDWSDSVDGADLGWMLAEWGTSYPGHDLNQDGVIDGGDLGLLLAQWGPVPQ
jgi:hypothetical protein